MSASVVGITANSLDSVELTAEQRRRRRRDLAIATLHRQGFSYAVLADVFDLHRTRIHKILQGQRKRIRSMR